MAPAARHPAAHRSELVRLVTRLAAVDVAPPAQTLAERLGDWLGWTDAIALSATLGDAGATPAMPAMLTAPTASRAAAALQRLVRARSALVRSAGEAGAFALAPATDAAELRRHLQARQRALEAGVAGLRTQVRGTLASHGGALRQLALLDAALEGALVGRERVSLALLPSLLERRWTRLRQAHAEAADTAWCGAFAADVQAVLRAELELRLQPVDGLLDALRAPALPSP